MSHFIKLIIRGKLDHWTWTGFSFQEPNVFFLLIRFEFTAILNKKKVLNVNSEQ